MDANSTLVTEARESERNRCITTVKRTNTAGSGLRHEAIIRLHSLKLRARMMKVDLIGECSHQIKLIKNTPDQRARYATKAVTAVVNKQA